MAAEKTDESGPWNVIGHIHTPFKTERPPIQGTANDAHGSVALLPAFGEGLADLDGFDRVWLIYLCPKDRNEQMKIVPRLDEQPRGVFATRSIRRPNPIGMTPVKLVRIQGCTLHVEGVDMLDGSLLLDLKPYVPRYDSYPESWAGWLENRIPHERAATHPRPPRKG